jgi:type VI secretion system VasI family protein
MFRYAALAAALVPALAVFAGPAQAEWHKVERSPASVVIYTMAGTGTAKTTSIGTAAAAPMLAVECSGGETRVIVYWREPMAGFYGQAVRYTIDGAGTRTEQWRLSTDQENMGHWGGAALSLVRRLTGGRSLTVRAISRRGVPMEATFRLTNLQQAAEPVARACKW